MACTNILKRLALLLLVVCAVFASCKHKSKNNPAGDENFDDERLIRTIETMAGLYAKDTGYTHHFDTLALFYQKRHYEPVWLSRLDSSFNSQLIQTIDSSLYDGLKPQHYHNSQLKYWLSRYKKLKGDSLYICLARLELCISDALITLWHDKVMGRTKPGKVIGSKYTLPYPVKTNFNLFSVLQADSGVQRIRLYQPKHPDYNRLRQLLVNAYSNMPVLETVIDTVNIRKLQPGDTTAIGPLLAKRLIELGIAPDSLALSVSGIIYDNQTAGYVKAFQLAHKLTDDGIIGKTTLKLLNASQNDRINDIRANMERLRWYDTEPEKPYILVNIPEFVLYLYYPDSITSMKVCIGKGKEKYYDEKSKRYSTSRRFLDKPQNYETPQIFSTIDHVVLNPTWTVPASIVGREMYSKIVHDPGYLPNNGYKVFSGDSEISAYDIKWKKYSPGNIPYTIRQNPGDDNSLGKIKFTFLNPFSVYLHDTPLKSKFKLNNRAVSHGCVRVEAPVALAGFVLQNNKKTTYDDVRVMLGIEPSDSSRARKWREDTTSYKKIVTATRYISIENKMTVVFDYRTVMFDTEGQAHFYYDVYDKNRLIAEAMDKP